MRIALLWWMPEESPGGARQAVRGNVKGVRDAGHEIDLYYADSSGPLMRNAGDYDMVISPVIYEEDYVDMGAFDDTHLHLQIGGFGDLNKGFDGIKSAINKADSVSALDLRPLFRFKKGGGMDVSDIRIIPNPPNLDLFDRENREESEGFVLVPKVGCTHKTGTLLHDVARTCGNITFEAHVDNTSTLMECSEEVLPQNVRPKPPVPFTHMQSRYRDCSMVFNASERDCLPNTVYEGFMTGRPVVADKSGIGTTQTIPNLDTTDFGMSAKAFQEKYKDDFFAGRHVMVTEEVGRMGNCMTDVLMDKGEWRELSDRGHNWVHETYSDWGWQEKIETILEVAR